VWRGERILRGFLKYQLPPLIWIFGIFVLSSDPKLPTLLRVPEGTDKIAHAFLFFVLCWLSWRAFFHQSYFPLLKRYALLGAFIFTVVYGLLDEFHQRFVPGRASDIYDVMADTGGALLYAVIAWMVQRPPYEGGHPE
jgi:VanZ family protein